MNGRWVLILLLLVQSVTCWSAALPEIDNLPFFAPSKRKNLPYFEQTTVEAYRKIGSHNSKWDASAEHALSIYARFRCDVDVVAGTTNYAVMTNELARAIAAGCDDPLVRYALVRQDSTLQAPYASLPFPDYTDVPAGLKAHPYPAILQTFMFARAADGIHVRPVNESDQLKSERLLQMAVIKLADAIKEKANRDEIYRAA